MTDTVAAGSSFFCPQCRSKGPYGSVMVELKVAQWGCDCTVEHARWSIYAPVSKPAGPLVNCGWLWILLRSRAHDVDYRSLNSAWNS